ncbi:MAG: phosphoribosylanthranilate isomerase [Halobacteriota archaeon]
MPRVKVCGFTREEDVAMAIDAGVDAVGAIVDVPVETPREISRAHARGLFDGVPPFVTTVLVTMSETVDAALELVERVRPDALQVHAGLSPDEVADLTAAIDADVIVAVDAGSADSAREYATVADAVLVDSTDESGAGGTGRVHDWERTRSLRDELDAPLVLAGGLTPGLVGAAIETVDPYAVDVASGVESDGGIKDWAAVADFVRAARSAEP